MNELLSTTTERYYRAWDEPALDDDPRDHLYEYIIDPEPLSDSHFDEGGEGD